MTGPGALPTMQTTALCGRFSRTAAHPMTPLSPEHAPRPRYTLALLTAMSALAFMDRQILSVLIEPVKAEFGLSDLQIGLVTGLGFALTFGILGVPLGRLAESTPAPRG